MTSEKADFQAFGALRDDLYERSPESRARVASKVADLRSLRRLAGRTQVEVAEALGSVQPAVSRTEHQADIHLSTLREYVAALGGTLRLVAVLDGHEVEFDLSDGGS